MRLFRICILTLSFILCHWQAYAQNKPKLLFDAEVMTWLKDISTPLLKHANIDPKDVNIYLINSNEVNAFVTPSKDIFFYSGLILKAEHAEEVQGVLAHEIGHIKAEHYLKTLAYSSEQKVPIVLGAILGVGAAALGSAEAATALLSGGLATAQDGILRHSRTHERQADKIAAKLLNQEGFSAVGLSSFFAKLQTSNFLYSRTPPEWLVTHPLPKQRISAMQEHVKGENFKQNINLNADVFKHIQAKLEVFTKPAGFVLRKYAYEDTPEAQYALALLDALQGNTQKSIESLKKWPETNYTKPFKNQLLGMLYQDLGEYKKAAEYFSKSIQLRGDIPLLRMNKAQNDILLGNLDDAISDLIIVNHQQPSWSSPLKQMAIAYGKKGELFKSHIHLAKEAILRENTADTKLHLQIAETHLSKNNPKQQKALEELKTALKISESDE